MLKSIKKYLHIFVLVAMGISFINVPSINAELKFDPNLIITDYDLTNTGTMKEEDIQHFLEVQGSKLANLEFMDSTSSIMKKASKIIYEKAIENNLNPHYILVLLQKEQSLIKDGEPTQDQLDWACGFGVCDACSKNDPSIQKYKGFYNQIDYATGNTRWYLDNPDRLLYRVGQTYIIDGQSVTIGNLATRALYTYTPHLHGNQNLWNIWNSWFVKSFPDGTLVQVDKQPGIWLIQDGKRRPFTSKSAFYSSYDPNKILKISQADLEKYDIGRAIMYANYSLVRSPRGTVYMIIDDQRRGFVSKAVMQKMGINPEEIEDVDWIDLSNYEEGAPLTLDSIYPTGALLQDKITGGVFYVKDGIRYPIYSKEILKSNFGNKRIIKTSMNEIMNYELGSPLKFKDGELVKASDDSAVYVISNGKRRPIASESAFNYLGYKFENIIITTRKAIEIHELGDIIDIANYGTVKNLIQ